ncbi:DUF58 domain-containing protein [Acidovorax sp. Root219]|uniref:DUF58 domain-containing protein n=1 Tax=Acidovorax sp. Root219 TaxID=1736493 RepID=UPI00070FDE36|nr:DUF58 domain-containing protein [Acidovorax sp. Root219]KRC16787.1 hypothetical protein ASE28_05620 [Acidovorax sp. Root219]
MECLLTRSRVLVAFCCTLLLAALNRRDPMVYGMFLFLTTLTVLGFVLPWLSLRGMSVRLKNNGVAEVQEGAACDLGLVVERSVRWPAFMVDVETEWEWAGHRMVLRQTVPVIRKGAAPVLGRLARFSCRGHYRLVAVRLASGFPLGLLQARRSMPQQHTGIAVHVLPRPQAVHWPLPWSVSPDASGTLATRHTGQSFELGLLREYQQGESVGRVSWRASARVGELVIQHFQQMGALALRLVVHAPGAPALGDPRSAGEQAIRLAAGVCDAALAQGAKVVLYPAADGEAKDRPPVQDAALVRQALASALPSSPEQLRQACARVAADARAGEQIALVVPGDLAVADLQAALAELARLPCTVVTCIALGPKGALTHRANAEQLRAVAAQAGVTTVLQEAP